MSPHRFYVPSPMIIPDRKIELPDAVARQIARVLRMREGDQLSLFDGSGREWFATIASIQRDSVSVRVGHEIDSSAEPRLLVTICQALIPSDRMEHVIQKCTELGVHRIVPVVTERVQSRDASPGPRRLERWSKIAVEAAEQSGRTRVPEIQAPVRLADCLAQMSAAGPIVFLWEEERGQGLRQVVRESLGSRAGHVSVLIGPVGGLSEAEADAARSAGALIAGAGSRILRAETAPVMALAILMYEAGELG